MTIYNYIIYTYIYILNYLYAYIDRYIIYIYVHIQIPYGSRGSPLLRPGAPAGPLGPAMASGPSAAAAAGAAAAALLQRQLLSLGHGEMVGKCLGNNMWNHGHIMRILWEYYGNIMKYYGNIWGDGWEMVVIELDDGKILTGKPNQFVGKNPWFPVIFPLNQSSEVGE